MLPLTFVQYQYTERTTAKVSSDFYIRFDNPYYSVDKAYLHKRVNVAATEDTVTIRSESGVFIFQWPRATMKGKWQTDVEHLPESCRMAVECRRTTYALIKNSIFTVMMDIASNEKKLDEKNRGAYAMPKTAMEIDMLLSRSQPLVGLKEGKNDNYRKRGFCSRRWTA